MAEKIAGINAVMEAIMGRRKVHRIFVLEGREGKRITELLQTAQKKGIYCQTVEKGRLDKMYKEGNHQGIVAEIDDYEYSSLEAIIEHAAIKGEKPFIIIIDGLEDPQNLGAIIRTAECAGVHGIIIPRHHSVEVTASVARVSAGALEHIRIARETNLVNCMQKLKEQGFWIIGADMEGEQDYFSTEIPEPAALVIGGENRGLRRLIKENCDLLLRIPMYGSINSLNASTAAALMIYELLRQRNNALKAKKD
jgi:23S rRNA (guanosine2251-2'-O)-methyltransferase